MYEALTRAGKKVEYLELPGGDHFLSSEQNRIAAFSAMGDFLDKYLPAN